MTPPRPQPRSFLSNVLWIWLGVVINTAAAVFLSPFMIRTLGHEGYGVWVLLFSVVEYITFTDLGIKSATIKYTAHFRALEDPGQTNRVLNTSIFYFSTVAVILSVLLVFLSPHVGHWFQISPGYQSTFSSLIRVIGIGCAAGLVGNVFTAGLEAFQRFDLTNTIGMSHALARTVCIAVVLVLGFGLGGIAIVSVAAQVLLYALSFYALRKAFPALSISRRHVNWPMLKRLGTYGRDTVPNTVAALVIGTAPSLLIGHFMNAAFVGYYGVCGRLVNIVLNFIYRIGQATGTKTAELCAREEHNRIALLAADTNRYSVSLFIPITVFLLVYGRQVLTIWVGSAFAAHSAPVLPLLLLGTLFGEASQFNSSAVLFGLAQHRPYSIACLAEALSLVAVLWFVAPRFGLVGVAWSSAVLMVASRGLLVSWLLCRTLGFPFSRFMRHIYTAPLLTAIPALGVTWALQRYVLPGENLLELAGAAAIVCAVFGGTALFTCLSFDHRTTLLARARLVGARFAS